MTTEKNQYFMVKLTAADVDAEKLRIWLEEAIDEVDWTHEIFYSLGTDDIIQFLKNKQEYYNSNKEEHLNFSELEELAKQCVKELQKGFYLLHPYEEIEPDMKIILKSILEPKEYKKFGVK